MKETEVARWEAVINGHKYIFSVTRLYTLFMNITCKENPKNAKRLEEEFNKKTHPHFPVRYPKKHYWLDAFRFMDSIGAVRGVRKLIKGDFSRLARNDIACQ